MLRSRALTGHRAAVAPSWTLGPVVLLAGSGTRVESDTGLPWRQELTWSNHGHPVELLALDR